MTCWRLRPGVRLAHDSVRDAGVLLHPEGVLIVNETAARVLALCDGKTDLAAIADVLSRTYDVVPVHDLEGFLDALARRRLVEPAEGARHG
ncbi:pyrroloquinoline quinone biosynthesis peptide chaperone PqqD [Streptomyces sp. UNOB3_S3]|uniref:pyrroloquinoline quinone biosynthesis peptide chaperone PqqD n=1 Tax=Streptomyces sp. UNOB3_S3 TaxID=2871682 RepID=UPI001E461199|nr:pyrroloquinoline quinone biosynthesis peptide chaperone PqqD [Streptomyces sp. UNOB3_S3]MCC3773747.1 pyrroloquinoline quinone biosynthesis peptide chaperone PqqD [Streptomyces sp. UNOB3_S3]